MFSTWLGRNFWMLVTGLLLTAVAILLHAAGYTEVLELFAYDLQVKHLSRVPASDAIVHIDIDDDALQRVGSWPWPRDVQADVIRTLNELQAGQIVTDLLYNEPRPLSLSGYRDPDTGPPADPSDLMADLLWPDDELADAIAQANNVYLALYYQETTQPAEYSPLTRKMADALRAEFSLDATTLAQRLNVTLPQIEAVLAGVKKQVAQELVAAVLDKQPQVTASQIHAMLLKTPFERLTADREDVQAAYQREENLRSLHDRLPAVPAGLLGKLPSIRSVPFAFADETGLANRSQEIMPPLKQLIGAGRGWGFVTFTPDADGMTRRICPLLEWDGRLVYQLGFAAVCDRLHIKPEELSIDRHQHLRIAAVPGRSALDVPLDGEGRMLLNWHVAAPGWDKAFRHLPVTQLLSISECQRRCVRNVRTKAALGAEIIRIIQGDAGYLALMGEKHTWAMCRQRLIDRRHTGEAGAAEIEQLRQDLRQKEKAIRAELDESIVFARQQWSELNAEPNRNDPSLAAERQRFAPTEGLLTQIDALEQANKQLTQQYQDRLARLRPLIAGKTCLVGYTATALADMIASPAYHRVPGVLVHSNVANSVLQNRFRHWTSRTLECVAIAVMGIGVMGMMTTLHPRTALLAYLVLAAALLSVNAVVIFSVWGWWVAVVTAVTIGLILWSALTLLRFLTTDRQRKFFNQAVAQYVSPAMARHMAENATGLDFTPMSREVTCFFSDIVSFTSMTERLGPAGTQAVLNPYLQAMSGVLHSQQGLINKFIGDGIFAFFNAPILPDADHASSACEAALECVAALSLLRTRPSDSAVAGEFSRLGMRIGIATGEVFVGDYGSANKLDYTCIGDTVNLASRLESANRVFGSTIMVSGQTRQAAGSRYEFRYFGTLRVKGRETAVDVYELLGRAGHVDQAALDFRSIFEEGVRAFQRGDRHQARVCFERGLERRPGERGTLYYLKALNTVEVNPPAAFWNGTLELSEK